MLRWLENLPLTLPLNKAQHGGFLHQKDKKPCCEKNESLVYAKCVGPWEEHVSQAARDDWEWGKKKGHIQPLKQEIIVPPGQTKFVKRTNQWASRATRMKPRYYSAAAVEIIRTTGKVVKSADKPKRFRLDNDMIYRLDRKGEWLGLNGKYWRG